MTELFQNVSSNFRRHTSLYVELLQNTYNAMDAARLLNEYAETLSDENEKDYIRFVYDGVVSERGEKLPIAVTVEI